MEQKKNECIIWKEEYVVDFEIFAWYFHVRNLLKMISKQYKKKLLIKTVFVTESVNHDEYWKDSILNFVGKIS